MSLEHRYRLPICFGQRQCKWTNILTDKDFNFPSGVDLQIQIAIALKDSPLNLIDIPNLSSINLEFKRYYGKPPSPGDPTIGDPIVGTIDDTTLSVEDWENDVSQHATFTMSSEQSNISPGKYWLAFSGVKSDSKLESIGWGVVEIVQDGVGPSAPVLDVPAAYYTQYQVDVLLSTQVWAPFELGVADPTITGVAAPLEARGKTNENPPRYFIKRGESDTDWVQELLNEEFIKVNGFIPPTGTTAEIDAVFSNSLAVPDAIYIDRDKGEIYQAITSSTRTSLALKRDLVLINKRTAAVSIVDLKISDYQDFDGTDTPVWFKSTQDPFSDLKDRISINSTLYIYYDGVLYNPTPPKGWLNSGDLFGGPIDPNTITVGVGSLFDIITRENEKSRTMGGSMRLDYFMSGIAQKTFASFSFLPGVKHKFKIRYKVFSPDPDQSIAFIKLSATGTSFNLVGNFEKINHVRNSLLGITPRTDIGGALKATAGAGIDFLPYAANFSENTIFYTINIDAEITSTNAVTGNFSFNASAASAFGIDIIEAREV